jgi:hypothetical protein
MGITLRLPEVLKTRMQEEGLSCFGLSRAIQRAYEKVTGTEGSKPPLDRRKLKRILDGAPNLTLSVTELEALDAYLSASNEGLAEKPLFRRDGILQTLAQPRVVFYVGTRSQQKPRRRHYMSVWDMRAYSAVQDGVSGLRPNTRSMLKDVVQVSPSSRILRKQLEDLGPETAVCSIGAPRSCLMSEVMLTEMFGIGNEAFSSPAQSSRAVPFYFVWPPQRGVQSRFALDWHQLTDRELGREVKNEDSWAFVLLSGRECEELALHWQDNPLRDYGVIVAQRRPRNQTWLVVAGLSGPGTCAAAQALVKDVRSRRASVPEAPHVLYAVVEADVTVAGDAKVPGDRRALTQLNLIVEPEVWRPADRAAGLPAHSN